nr:hypothetical protein [Tanacetum cinerariifolium]
MKMEILLEPTSNKLMVGNPVKKILLTLNLSDHRKLKDGGEDGGCGVAAEVAVVARCYGGRVKMVMMHLWWWCDVDGGEDVVTMWRLVCSLEGGRNPSGDEARK